MSIDSSAASVDTSDFDLEPTAPPRPEIPAKSDDTPEDASQPIDDSRSYEQFTFEKADLQWEVNFLRDDMEGITAFKTGEEIFAIELPNTVSLKVEDTPPAIKGATATARTKPATMETGVVVQVPEHIRIGDMLNVDTRTGVFLGRTQS